MKTNKNPIRHTHQTAAGIEDALSALIDVIMDLEALRLRSAAGSGNALTVLLDLVDDLEVLRLRTERAADILKQVRSGPHAYDPEQPAGLRVVVKRKA